MNAINNCIENVGFWVTDEGTWNTLTPEKDGVLYRCDNANNWELYYTPYTYPHPLRNEGSEPSTCIHEADNNPCNNCVSQPELTNYVNRWFSGEQGITIELVAGAIDEWSVGSC